MGRRPPRTVQFVRSATFLSAPEGGKEGDTKSSGRPPSTSSQRATTCGHKNKTQMLGLTVLLRKPPSPSIQMYSAMILPPWSSLRSGDEGRVG